MTCGLPIVRRDVALRAIFLMTWLQRSLAVLQAHWRPMFAVGLALAVVGWGLRVVEALATDSPTGEAWRSVGRAVFQPWLDRDAGLFRPLVWFWREAEPGLWWWTLGELAWNGQWDPRLSALAAIAAFAVATGVAATMLVGKRGATSAKGVALLALAGLCLPRLPLDLVSPEAVRVTGLLALGLLHVGGTCRSSGRIWGHAAGLVGAVLSTAGAASALASLVVAGAEREDGDEARRLRRWTMGGNGLLLVAVGLRATFSPDGLGGAFRLGETLRGLDATQWAAGVVLVLPGLIFAIRALWTGQWTGEEARRLVVLGLWIPIFAGMGGVVRHDGTLLVLPWFALALLVQGACWAKALSNEDSRWARVAALGGAWLVALAPVVVAMNRGVPAMADLTVAGQVRSAAVRTFMVEGDEQMLLRGLPLSPEEIRETAPLLRDSRLARWLPASLRDPLTLQTSEPTDDAFTATRVPALDGLPSGYAIVGNLIGEDDGRLEGEWRSGMMTTSFPLVQIHVAGRGRPGQTHLWLEAPDGSVGTPLQSHFTALHQWRRINIPVPAHTFTLAVSDRSSDDWLAVSAPVEVGRGTWLVGKLAGGWRALSAGALILLGFAAVGAGREIWRERTPAFVVEGRARTALRWLPWFLLAGYAAVLSGFLDTHAAGADSAGYLGNARLLREGKVLAEMRTVPDIEVPSRLYAPLGFHPRDDEKLAPTYPSGLSLMIAAAATVLPFKTASAVVIWVHLLAGVGVARWLARECGLEDGWAWLAAMMIGLCPLYLFMGLQPMSDGPSLVWLTLAVIFGLRGRDHVGWALASGAATAMTVLLRPANAIAFLPLLIALGSWRAVLLWVAGALPGAAWQLWHAWALFGSPFATGYGNMRAAFGFEWIAPTAGHAVVQLTVAFTPVIWLAVIAPFLRSVDQRVRWVLGGWVLVYFGFYAVYYYTHLSWWYLRFVLPAYPALVVLALLGLRALTQKRGWALFSLPAGRRTVVVSIALTVALAANALFQDRRLLALHSSDGNRLYSDLAAWMKAEVPSHSAVFTFEASGALFLHTDLVVLRLDQVDAQENTRMATHLRQGGHQVFAVIFHLEEQAETNARLPKGDWVPLQRFGHVEVLRLEALHGPDTGGLR